MYIIQGLCPFLVRLWFSFFCEWVHGQGIFFKIPLKNVAEKVNDQRIFFDVKTLSHYTCTNRILDVW